MATGKPVAKFLIKYNRNNLEKRRRREGVNLYWVYWGKSYLYNDENAIDFKWSDVKEEDEEDNPLIKFIESLQKQTDEEIFP